MIVSQVLRTVLRDVTANLNPILMKKLLLLFALVSSGACAQRPSRYQGEFNMAYAIGVGNLGLDRLNVETVHGVRFSPYLMAGVGLGIHMYTWQGMRSTLVPIFVDMKGYFMRRRTSPYLGIDLGYGIGTGVDRGVGGLYVSPTFGVSCGLGGNAAFILGIAFQSQQLLVNSVSVSFNAVAVKAAVTF